MMSQTIVEKKKNMQLHTSEFEEWCKKPQHAKVNNPALSHFQH